MYCAKCGKKIREESAFCPYCGNKIPAKVQPAFQTGSVNDGTGMIEAAKRKDQQAMAALYAGTARKAFYIAKTMLNEEDAANDVLQESYITAFNSLNSFQGNLKNFQSWIDTIVINKCKDELRKKKPILFTYMQTPDEDESEPDFEDTSDTYSPEANVDYSETKRLIGEMIGKLPYEQKVAMTMYYLEEANVEKIAEVMGCSANTVKSRLRLARNSMKNQVLALEKQGTRLYCAPLLPFLFWFFRQSVRATALPVFYSGWVTTGAAASGMATPGTATNVMAAPGTAASGTAVPGTATAGMAKTAVGNTAAAAEKAKAAAAGAGAVKTAFGLKAAVLAVVVATGVTAGVIGTKQISNRQSEKKAAAVQTTAVQAAEVQKTLAASADGKESVEDKSDSQAANMSVLTDQEQKTYKAFLSLLRSENQKDIVDCYKNNLDTIASIGEKVSNRVILYDGSKEIQEGKGVVILSNGIVYTGEFSSGKPNGKGFIANRDLSQSKEGKRRELCSYAFGNWIDGKINGPACTGKDFLPGNQDDRVLATMDQVSMKNDLFEGIGKEIMYEFGDKTGYTFTINYEDGKIVLDDRWKPNTSDKEKGMYSLSSENQTIDTSNGKHTTHSVGINYNPAGKEIKKNCCVWDTSDNKSGKDGNNITEAAKAETSAETTSAETTSAKTTTAESTTAVGNADGTKNQFFYDLYVKAIHKDKANGYRYYMLPDIDLDGTPELITFTGFVSSESAMKERYYTIRDNKLISLGENGGGGTDTYVKKEGGLYRLYRGRALSQVTIEGNELGSKDDLEFDGDTDSLGLIPAEESDSGDLTLLKKAFHVN